MSSGVEADIALDAAVVLTLGLNRALGATAGLAGSGADALAAFAAARAAAKQQALDEIERYDRAIRGVLDRNARIAALAESQRQAVARHGIQPVPVPEPMNLSRRPGGPPAEGELTDWCAQADAAIAAAEDAVSVRVAGAVAGSLFAAPAAGLASDVGPGEQAPDQAEESIAAAVTRVLARLLPDTSEADHRSVAEAAARVAAAATASEAQGLLTEVRLRVQRANENTGRRRTDAARQAAEREARAQAEAEREYVLDAVTSAFTDLGYEVDAGFETLTARDGEVLLTRGDWPQHAVKLQVDDAYQVRAAMLRTEAPRSDDERRLDVEREQQWCDAFEAARARLAAAGVRSDIRWRLEPGRQRLPVTARPAPRRPAAKARERERRHEP
jgi:hypothetical protein